LNKGLFFTEASQQVGYGHLMECLAVAEQCKYFSDIFFALIDSDKDAIEIIKDKGFALYSADLSGRLHEFNWAFMSTRDNEFALQEKLIRVTDHLLILDELGHKRVKCHSLINFSVIEDWHEYEVVGPKPELYLGTDYYPLREQLRHVSQKTEQKGGSVLVTLGGADRTNTTLRLAEVLGGIKYLECTYVIGPGSSLKEADILGYISDPSKQKVVKLPSNFDELLASHNIVISAGGNTLYEAAFLEKIILVIWEDEHERTQGEAFEQKGLAYVVGGPDYLDNDLMLNLITASKNHNVSQEVINNRLMVIDGKGIQRIVSIISSSRL
jgi:spore coat polysaccharide biosynthesis predicted glycosyltransferase SpsG